MAEKLSGTDESLINYMEGNGTLLQQYKAVGDEEEKIRLRNEIAKQNDKLIHLVINKYFPNTGYQHRDDMYSEGYLGLINAIETYDPDKGVNFSTWATKQIRFAILNSFRSNSIKTPKSLDEPVGEPDSSESSTLAEFVADQGPDVHNLVINSLRGQQDRLMPVLKDIFAESPEQLKVVVLRHGLAGGDPMTPSQIAASLDIPAAKTRKLLAEIEKKFRMPKNRRKIWDAIGQD